MYTFRKISLFLNLLLSFSISFSQVNDNQDVFSMSLKELASLKIISTLNIEEKLSDTPANIIVISKEDIKLRGYNDLIEIFNDLPGIDLSLTYGDLYAKSYWRGFRTGMPSPYLFMIDGMVFNHLWYNWTDIMVAVPLSNIEQIEIVYGPASSVYGANALMGVFNIITKNNFAENGLSSNVKLVGGTSDKRIFDINLFYKKDDLRFSFTGFFNHGDLDKNSLDTFEYTKNKYLTDKSLWGDYLNNPDIAGSASSPRNNKAIVFKAMFKNSEVGLQYYVIDNGWGLTYSFDKIQPLSKWIEPELNLYIKHKQSFSKSITSTSLIRYRESDVSNTSNSLESRGDFGEKRKLVFGYWQSLNKSMSFYQDFDIKINDSFLLKTGLKYENKDLQKAYDLPYGITLVPDSVNLTIQGIFPNPPVNTYRSENRTNWIDEALYLQSKYKISKLLKTNNDHSINFGFRLDNNSYYGSHHTFRLGYTGKFNKYGIKILFGQAFQEPTPRHLFASWAGSGKNPNLIPEESQTFEYVLSYISNSNSFILNAYYNKIENLIVELENQHVNQGKMDVFGFDIHTQFKFSFPKLNQLKLWAFYSFMITDVDKFDNQNLLNASDEVGDMAKHKLYFGLTSIYKKLNCTIIGRYIGDKTTVDTNPVKKVEGWVTIDLNIRYKNLLKTDLAISLKIKNVFDKKYYHPGIRTANSGNIPGFWKSGKWFGSRGWHNSLLPQPGRSFSLALEYEY